MASINPYLTFNGNCEEAFNFYKSVFGGNFSYVGRYIEMSPETKVSDSEKEKIMHISLPISKETSIMGADSSESFGKVTKAGDNFSIPFNAETEEEAKRIFNGLSAGGMGMTP